MIGDEKPWGSSVFQITFLSGPNSAGSPLVGEIPEPFGPRNLDQSVSEDAAAASADRSNKQLISIFHLQNLTGDEEIKRNSFLNPTIS